MNSQCGMTGGWTVVVNAHSYKCPKDWQRFVIPGTNYKAACKPPSDDAGCYSAMFPTRIHFKYICGVVDAYTKGTPDAFSQRPMDSINQPYLDGISITYGTSDKRRHVWSYAVGYSSEDSAADPKGNCPCAAYPGPKPPSFVRDDYYCNSPTTGIPQPSEYHYQNESLWSDIAYCSEKHSCCAQGEAPYFLRDIPDSSRVDTDPIEVRICTDEGWEDEGIMLAGATIMVM